MKLITRHLPTCGTLAAVVVCCGASAAAAGSPVKITDCIKAKIRPASVTLTCGDGNTVLTGLHWSSFGGAVANARGTFAADTCKPNCASGKVVRYPVAVKASGTRSCKRGLRVYDKVTLSFSGRKPSEMGRLRHWTLGCPT